MNSAVDVSMTGATTTCGCGGCGAGSNGAPSIGAVAMGHSISPPLVCTPKVFFFGDQIWDS